MIPRFLSRMASVFRHRAARRAYDAACGDAGAAFANLLNAIEREDDRDVGRYRAEMARATVARLKAENVLFKPVPLPRPSKSRLRAEGEGAS